VGRFSVRLARWSATASTSVAGHPIVLALAHTGYLLNLFNLAPLGVLDGGAIVTALSPWLWLIGAAIIAVMLVANFNVLLLVILIVLLSRLTVLFREELGRGATLLRGHTARRWAMAACYFGLIGFLVFAMNRSRIEPRPDGPPNPRHAAQQAEVDTTPLSLSRTRHCSLPEGA
jgi:Zn-dependent protease